ncbi:MAG: presqualene diphosphate synthase HpnD [Rhodovibrionaceae bacterium]|nr:presqualene diphosphate synthase HpnD [Rhodovibrionaceae bacterium]
MSESVNGTIELPATKGRGGENFPVGSWLLPARLRPSVHAFYNFARAADDIADSPDLPAEEKLARLERMERAVLTGDPGEGADKAAHLNRVLTAEGLSRDHAVALLSAFKQDAVKGRYETWEELLDYCSRSAHPVGRFLIELHGEHRHAPAAEVARVEAGSDALCAALQVLNHLQDMAEDYRDLDRVYLPQAWMRQAGAEVGDLTRDAATPGLREVIDRCLDGVDVLLRDAEPFPQALASPRLAAESGAIVRLARGLSSALRQRDPLAGKVKAKQLRFLGLAALGAGETLAARLRRPRATRPKTVGQSPGKADSLAQSRAYARAVVTEAGSSFNLGMRVLPPERREAMFAIYAFCRDVDDIADGDRPDLGTSIEAQRKALTEWRWEMDRIYDGAPAHPLGPALAAAARKFDLPKREFLRVIEGMRMDLDGENVAPDDLKLTEYCRCVAGAVGMVSVRAFGAEEPEAEKLAVVLGEALQLTNILRDLDEDAALGRLYLPESLLQRHGLPTGDPKAVLDHPDLDKACMELAERAEDRFAEARALITQCNRERLLPSILMLEIYHILLQRLVVRGWRAPRRPVSLSRGDKLRVLLRHARPMAKARLSSLLDGR